MNYILFFFPQIIQERGSALPQSPSLSPSGHAWVRPLKIHLTRTPWPLLTRRRYKLHFLCLHVPATHRLRPRVGYTTRWSCPGCPRPPTCPLYSTCPPWTIITTTTTTTTTLPSTPITTTWTCPCTTDPHTATTDASSTHCDECPFRCDQHPRTHTRSLAHYSHTFHFSAFLRSDVIFLHHLLCSFSPSVFKAHVSWCRFQLTRSFVLQMIKHTEMISASAERHTSRHFAFFHLGLEYWSWSPYIPLSSFSV